MSFIQTNRQWKQTAMRVLHLGEDVSPRGMPCKEDIAGYSVWDMDFPIITVPERKLNYQFMFAEAEWMLSGSDELNHHPAIAKRWAPYSDDGETLHGAYGPRVMSQLFYIGEVLQKDRDSRQAVLTTWRQCPVVSKDIPCTVSMQFLIRDNHLHMVANMRSSDVYLGLPYDVFCFSMIAWTVRSIIGLDLNIGNLHVIANSSHIYHKDMEKCEAAAISLNSGEYKAMSAHGLNTPDVIRECLRNWRDDPKMIVSMP